MKVLNRPKALLTKQALISKRRDVAKLARLSCSCRWFESRRLGGPAADAKIALNRYLGRLFDRRSEAYWLIKIRGLGCSMGQNRTSKDFRLSNGQVII